MSIDFSEAELLALKKEHAANATDEQFALWIAECRTRNLAPVRDIIMQIRTSEEWDPEVGAKVKKKKSIYIVTIGAKRKIANATGLYAGQLPTKWIYLDKNNQPTIESEIPLPDPANPMLPLEPWAVRTSILRTGFQAPLTVVSRFGAYCQTFKRNGEVQLTAMWSANGRSCEMLEKCGESSCLTRAFPSELSGLYIAEELQKDDVVLEVPPAEVKLTEAPKAAVVPTVNHEPATPTNEPRPEEKPRTKKNVKDVKIEEVILDRVEVVGGEVTSVTVIVPPEGTKPEQDVNLQIDKPAPTVHLEINTAQSAANEPVISATVQKMDNSKDNNTRLRELIAKGVDKDKLKQYILITSGREAVNQIPTETLKIMLSALEQAMESGGKEAVAAVIEPKTTTEEEPF